MRLETERLLSPAENCDDGDLYFRKTWFGFGSWVEENRATDEATLVSEFDVDNKVVNRLLALQAEGWGNLILAGIVACRDDGDALLSVLR